jgi:uncharacterized protein
MKEEHVTFKAGDLTLEGLMANPGGGARAAVVCHPHPMYGGSMNNNVVEAILATLWQFGCSTLRFNFRGVGASEGEHDGGIGEVDDALEALTFLQSQDGVHHEAAIMAGYSFGAAVALEAGLRNADIGRIVAVALPVAMIPPPSSERVTKPILLASGDRDSYSPIPKLEELVRKLGAAAQLEIVKGADHFFGGYEDQLSAAIKAAL